MNTNFYDLYYTVIKNRDKKNADAKYENNFFNYEDFIIANHKPCETILK